MAKVIKESDYELIGKEGMYYIFKSVNPNFDDEVIKIVRAKFILMNGKVIYLD